MRSIEKVAQLKAGSEWDLAREFVELTLWPYFVRHEPDSQAEAHYHRTDEELQVVRGSMTFFDMTRSPARRLELRAGERARIPEGTVHRVTIGSDGVS